MQQIINNKSFLIGIILALIMMGCTRDFEETNTNPISPVDVQPEFLLRKVLFDFAEQMSYEGFVAGNLLGQYFTAIDFNLFDRHSLSEPQYGGKPWSFMYENLRDNDILLAKAQSNPTHAVYEGPALIYRSYVTAALTDLYGDVPYFDALKGKDGIVTPKYDSQRDIYLGVGGIIDNLDKAIAAIKSYQGAIKLNGDIIYNGDLSKWLKLANTLKFKYLIRISDKENVTTQLQQLANEAQFITNPLDNAVFQFSAGPPNNFRMTVSKTGDYNLFVMSKTIDSILTRWNDPRVAVYFRPTAADATVYRGLLNGPDASNLSFTASNYSLTGRIFREDGTRYKANFMTSFELHFLIAEAVEREWITGYSAKDEYEKGIKQAFDYWYTVMPDSYLTQADVAYSTDTQTAMSQIITQKWLANIGNGYEGWVEYRRTGYPALKTVAASLNQNIFPVRMPYPSSEAALNANSYQSAAASTNNNSINFPVWWDQ